MKTDFIDINLAASISGKSLQTIRRAIKTKKISARKKKTPQGFSYFISKQSVLNFFDLKNSSLKEIPLENHTELTPSGLKNPDSRLTSQLADHLTSQISSQAQSGLEMKELKRIVQSFMTQYQKEREHFGAALNDLQGRLMVAENQVRLLCTPKKKWFQFWKS